MVSAILWGAAKFLRSRLLPLRRCVWSFVIISQFITLHFNGNRVSEGNAFAIHDPDVFMTDISPQFFDKQSRLRSFHRQLSIWVSSYHSVVSLITDHLSIVLAPPTHIISPSSLLFLLRRRGFRVLKQVRGGEGFGFTSISSEISPR